MPPLPEVVTADDVDVFTTRGEDPDEMTWHLVLHRLVRRGLDANVVDAWLRPGGEGASFDHEFGTGRTTLRPAPGEAGMIEPWERTATWSGNREREVFEGGELRALVAAARALCEAGRARRAAENTRPLHRRVALDASGQLCVHSDGSEDDDVVADALRFLLTLDRAEDHAALGGDGYIDELFSVAPGEPTDDETEPGFGMREPWYVHSDYPSNSRRWARLEGDELRALLSEARRLVNGG